jgi:hypothetical protein
MFRRKIRRFDSRRTGINIDEVPGRERTFFIKARFNLDNAGRPEIGPRELFLARPAQGNGFAGGLREAGCFDTGFAAVLASKARAEIGNHDLHFVIRQMKGSRQLGTTPEGILAAGPNFEFAVGPFSHGRARFQGGVLDIGDVVGLPKDVLRLGKLVSEIISDEKPSFDLTLLNPDRYA